MILSMFGADLLLDGVSAEIPGLIVVPAACGSALGDSFVSDGRYPSKTRALSAAAFLAAFLFGPSPLETYGPTFT